MFKPVNFLLLSLIVTFSCCKNESGYNYAIKDFRKPLQPFLLKIASRGIVEYHDSADISIFSDEELMQLGKAENPVLRATAFREMLQKKSFDHFDLLMNHLDDTALVPADHGEFGISFVCVSDDILGEARWKTKEAKNKTIDQVLTKHNYLRLAYTILRELEAQEKYYSAIKDMATRPRHLTEDGYETGFRDIEYALYGLATFRKQGDVKIIKDKMMQNVYDLSDLSFRLMKEFPDTVYFDVLQKYHHRQFYRFSGNRPYGFTGVVADNASPEDFISALVMQQSNRSARLLDTMLNLIPLQTCLPDKKGIFDEVVNQIWNHPCPAYASLREKIKPRAKEMLKREEGILPIPMDSSTIIPIDTTIKEKIWW